MTSSDRDVKYQTLAGAWCEYERSKKGCGELPHERFDFGAGDSELVPVPQVDTEITLNLSGTEVCNINHLIDTEYEVTTLPYTSVSHVSDTSIDSTDIKCVQKLNSSEMSLDIDDSDHHHNNMMMTSSRDDDYLTNRNAIETKLSTPEPPLLDTSDEGRILDKIEDEDETPSTKTNADGDESRQATTLIGTDNNNHHGGDAERFSVASNDQLDCNQFLNLHRQSSSGSLMINQDNCVSTETIPSLPSSIEEQKELVASLVRSASAEEKATVDEDDDERVLDGSGFAAPAGSLADDESDGGDDRANSSAVKECTIDDSCLTPSTAKACNNDDNVNVTSSPQPNDKPEAITHDDEVSTIMDLLNRAASNSSISLERPVRSSTPQPQEDDQEKEKFSTTVTVEPNTITNSSSPPPTILTVEGENNAVVKENDENQVPPCDVVTTQSVIVTDPESPVTPVVATTATTDSDSTLAINKERLTPPVLAVVDSTNAEQSSSDSSNTAAVATTAESTPITISQRSDEDTLSSSETELILAAAALEQDQTPPLVTTPNYKFAKGVIIKKEMIDYELNKQQQANCGSPSATSKKPLVASPVYIKSSIPTGKKLTIVRNIKTVPIKPIYKFDKVSIKTMGPSKTAVVNGNQNRGAPVVHRFKNLPPTSTAPAVKTFQPITSTSTSPGVTKVQSNNTQKPPNIFNLLKGERSDKYKTIGNRIVVPMDLKTLKIPPKRTSTVLGANSSPLNSQRPMVVIKKGNTLCPGTISTLPRPSSVSKPATSSSSSGSIIHRVSHINIVGKNTPSVIKRFQPATSTAATNLNGDKLTGRQQLRTFSITSPVQSRLNSSPNLPIIRQYNSNIPRNAAKLVTVSTGGQECTRVNMPPGSPANSTHASPILIGRHNWSIKKEIKQENISSSPSSSSYHHRPSILHGYNQPGGINRNNRSPYVKGLYNTHNSASRLLNNRPGFQRLRSASPAQPFDVFDELTNLDWLKDDDRSLLRQIRKLNPDDPGIGLSGDESDGDGFADKRRDNKSIFTAYSKVYGPNYCSVNRAHTDYQYDPNSKPPYSFSSLIFMAVEDSDAKKLPVKDIYHWVCRHFPYFRTAPPGWKNSIRHNLSLNRCFKKADQPHREKESAKGALWCIDLAYRTNLVTALKRSPYYPFLHPVGFNDKEPLKNLCELLPGMKKERPPTPTPAAEEPPTTTDSKDLWAVEDINQRKAPDSSDGAANSIPRSESSESVGKEELVITDPVNEEHTYSSPNSKNKKQQQRKQRAKKQKATTSAKTNQQQRRCASPTTSDKSAPDAAYEFGMGGVTSSDCDDVVQNGDVGGGMMMGDGDLYIDEVDLTEIGNEVEIMSDTEEEEEDEYDDSQMLFDSGFASLKQFSMKNRREHELEQEDDDDDERLGSTSPTPSSKWYMSDEKFASRCDDDDDDSSDTDCSSLVSSDDDVESPPPVKSKRKVTAVNTEPPITKRNRGRRSKNSTEATTTTNNKLKVRVGRPSKISTNKRMKEDVAGTVPKRRRNSSTASKVESQSARSGRVGRPRGPVRKTASKATAIKNKRSEKKVVTTTTAAVSKKSLSSNSHYHTRSSGHKLLSQEQKRGNRKRRMKTSESSSAGRSADDHRSKTKRKLSADGAAETTAASSSSRHGDIDQMMAAAECLLSLGLRRDESNRSTSSIDTQNTNS